MYACIAAVRPGQLPGGESVQMGADVMGLQEMFHQRPSDLFPFDIMSVSSLGDSGLSRYLSWDFGSKGFQCSDSHPESSPIQSLEHLKAGVGEMIVDVPVVAFCSRGILQRRVGRVRFWLATSCIPGVLLLHCFCFVFALTTASYIFVREVPKSHVHPTINQAMKKASEGSVIHHTDRQSDRSAP